MSVTELPARESEFERTPPHDMMAEQCTLGGMLLSQTAIAEVIEIVSEQDFYRPAHQMIFDCVLDLYGRGEPADTLMVKAELEKKGDLTRVGGAPYLHTLISSVPTAANAGYYAKIVYDRAVLRRLVEVGTRIAQMGYSTDGSEADALLDRAQAEVYAIADKRATEDYVAIREVMPGALDEIEAIGSQGGQMTGVPTGFTDLDSLMNGLHGGQMIIIAARPAIGKALALDTPLPTPSGWTTMGAVQVGDQLLAADGTPTTVVAATDVMVDRPCHEVTFDDGTAIVADAEHQWLTDTRASRKSAQAAAAQYNRYRNQRTFASVKTTKEIAETLRCPTGDQRLNHSVTNALALELPEADLPVPPYTLGAWLGDGHSAAARVTTADPEIIIRIEADGIFVKPAANLTYWLGLPEQPPLDERSCLVCGKGFQPRTPEVRTCGRVCGGRARFISDPVPAPQCEDCGRPFTGARRCAECIRDHGSLRALLRSAGVLENKHIPDAYLRASIAQRRALLAGLLDTDGTVNPTGSVQFAVTNRRLAEDFRELVLSLGYRCGMSTRKVRGRTEDSSVAYTITFTTSDEVFVLERKKLVHKERDSARHPKSGARFVTSARPVPSVPVRCVQIDHTDHLYLASRSMVPTHNSTLALDLARAASIKHQLASVIFSLEMGRNEITMRLLSAEARVGLHAMRSGSMTDDDWTRLARRMSEVAEAPLFIDDSPNMSMMEIRAKCRRLKQQHDLRLVIIDYLQLMTSGKRVESRQVEVSEFSRSLKLLAKEIEVPVIALSQLNRGPEQRTDKKPMLSDLRESGCVTAATRILRADTGAEITMGELISSEARDIPVWALDERLKYVPRVMTHAFPSGRKEVFRLRLASGREIEATANHPFLVYGGWMPLAELTVGSKIATVRHVPPPLDIQAMSDDELVMLAHLIGDGSFVRRQPIRYASQDEECLTAVTEAAKHFGISAVRDDYAAARVTTLRLPAPYRLARGRRNPIAQWLDDFGLFGLRSHEKFVPAQVFQSPKEQVALFLRHLWATDGCVYWDEKNGQCRLYYGSTSRRLVDDVARLLSRFGILTRIKKVTKKGYRPSYHLHIYGGPNQLVFFDVVGVHGARGRIADVAVSELRGRKSNTNVDTIPPEVWDDVRTILAERKMTHRQFAAAIGTQFCGSTLWKHAPSRERLGRIAGVLDSAELELFATNDVLWDEIVAVESTGEQEVYDATVPGLSNFIANGIAIHNSIEQDADAVILLHREDAYEKESPRAGEADLIVAKHRNGPTATVTVAFQGHYSRFVDMAPG